MFENFDFSILEDPDFKEDSVREEIISPLLSRLGYSATGRYRLIRSKTLTHPFVMIGSKKHPVSIIPDYLYKAGENVGFVLDAKSPKEVISKGNNVAQAYSYAIHPDVRVNVYCLCNGRDLVIFDIFQFDPVLVVPIQNIDKRWNEIENYLSPSAIENPSRREFLPDFGLAILKSGVDETTQFIFLALSINMIMAESRDRYSMSSEIKENDGAEFMATFDLNEDQLQFIVGLFPEEIAGQISYGLNHQPFRVKFNRPILLGVKSRRIEPVESVNGEVFCPLLVEEVFESPFGTFSLI